MNTKNIGVVAYFFVILLGLKVRIINMEATAIEHKQLLAMSWIRKIFVAFVFLMPIFFIPTGVVPFQFGKAFFVTTAAILFSVAVLIKMLRSGVAVIPKSKIFLGIIAVVVASAISAAFSSHAASSFFGQGFEIGTVFSTFAFALLSFLVPIIFKDKKTLFNLYLALIASYFLVVLFQLVRLLAPGTLSFGTVFQSAVSSVVGIWNDLGIFSGFIVLTSLISLAVLDTRGMWKNSLKLALVLGLIILTIVNFETIWILLAIFSAVFFIYSLSYAKKRGVTGSVVERARHVSYLPVIVFIFSAIFVADWTLKSDVGGTPIPGPIGTYINSQTKATQLEVRPSWSSTIDIAKSALSEHPIIGIGPNHFTNLWNEKKPKAVNQTIFWNVDFPQAVGFIPTYFISLGLLGIIAWLTFFAFFSLEGVRAIRRLHGDAFSHYLLFSSFIGAVYFWLVAILYTPTHVPVALAFIFTGIFVATLAIEGVVSSWEIAFAETPGKSFMGSLVIVVLLIGLVTCTYFAVKRVYAYVNFNRTLAAYQKNNDLASLEEGVRVSLNTEESDFFYRTLADVYLARLNSLLQQNPKDENETLDLQNQFKVYMQNAIVAGQLAAKDNPVNYLNWLELGRVYAAITPLKIEGAYDQSVSAYKQALDNNPNNPLPLLEMARLNVATGNQDKAIENLNAALSLKANYTDAVFLLTQIEVSKGETEKAIQAVSNAVLLSPTDATLLFQLGLLYYNDANYPKAINALEQAVYLQNQYANAKYFLGLSYSKVGRTPEAVLVFTDLASSNPDNAEVKLILSNLKAGRAPFTSVAPPLDNKPEKRKTPPVSEKKPTTANQGSN